MNPNSETPRGWGRGLAPIRDQKTVVGDPRAAGQILVSIGERADRDHILFADFREPLADVLVKMVFSDLDVIGVPKAFHAQLPIALLSRHFKRGQRLGNQALGRAFVDWNDEVLYFLGCGGRGHGIDDAPDWLEGSNLC